MNGQHLPGHTISSGTRRRDRRRRPTPSPTRVVAALSFTAGGVPFSRSEVAVTDLGCGGVDELRTSRDGHRLGHVSHLQRDVQDSRLSYGQDDSRFDTLAEAIFVGGNSVAARELLFFMA
jgi:hypothetical protein